jgi:hypothetical protein
MRPLTLTIALLLASASSHVFAAPLVQDVVGVYDSPNNSNTVDRTASGNVATFTADVATAFGAGLGGVINFDGQNFNGLDDISARFGIGFSKTLTIDTSAPFNNQSSSNIRAISGTENVGTGQFLLAASGSQFYTFTIGEIVGGAEGEGVTQLGFTVLTRNGGGTPSISALATFSDGSTFSSQAFGFTVTTTPEQDTFYGFTAPAGTTIRSVQLNYGADGDLRRGIDDLAFITSVIPEPTTSLLAFFSLVGLLGFRRAPRAAR